MLRNEAPSGSSDDDSTRIASREERHPDATAAKSIAINIKCDDFFIYSFVDPQSVIRKNMLYASPSF